MKPVLPVLSVFLVANLALLAQAQETILDPENPRSRGNSTEDEGEGRPESISDPENPLLQPRQPSAEEGEGSETIFDPEHPLGVTAEPEEPVEAREAEEVLPGGWFTVKYLGRFHFDTRVDNDLEDIFLLQNRLDLRTRLSIARNWRAVLEGRLEHWLWGESNPEGPDLYFNGENYQGLFEATLRDANLSAQYGRFFLTVGNQTIVWGAGTLAQPAAMINALDLRQVTFDTPADVRLPGLAAEAAVVLDRISLSAVLVPFFQPHEFVVRDTDFAVFSAARGPGPLSVFEGSVPSFDSSLEPSFDGLLLVTELPEAAPRNASGGARVTSSYGGFDLGVGYFYGWDRLPFLELTETSQSADNADSEDFFRSRYLRRQTVEVDLVKFIGRVGVRAEAAFSPERTMYTEEPDPEHLEIGAHTSTVSSSNRLPVLAAAFALSYEKSEWFFLQVEGFWQQAFRVPSRATVALWGGNNNLTIALLAELGMEEFRALRDTFISPLSFRMSGRYGLRNCDLLLFPSATWALSDAVNLSVGVAIFEGLDQSDDESLGDVLDESDQAYVSFDATF